MAFYIRNLDNGLVLDVKGDFRSQGTPVIMYPYKGSPNQLWEYKKQMLYSKASGMVLTIDQREDADKLVIWDAHGRDNQIWYFDQDSSIRSRTGQVVDIQGENRNSDAPLIAFRKHLKWNQKFQVVPYSC